jgi:hypothetical protein
MHAVTYVLSRFPFLRNTFIVRELDGITAAGMTVDLIALLRPEAGIRHARTVDFGRRSSPMRV